MSKRKPMLLELSAWFGPPNVLAGPKEEAMRAELRAAEAVCRAARRWRDEETDDDRNAAVKLCRALARLDRVTWRKP